METDAVAARRVDIAETRRLRGDARTQGETVGLTRIDLNADLAEECGGDDEIFPCLSSANVCCGAHAGGPDAMEHAVTVAAALDVTVGAHVGYADRENFGRVPMDIAADALYAALYQQIAALEEICERHGTALRYVKPHGALYHRVGSDEEQARALVTAVAAFELDLHLLVPDTSLINRVAAEHDLTCHYEYFADRGYNSDGTLVDRRLPGAMLTDTHEIVDRALRWLETGMVRSVAGEDIVVRASSICLHGDEPEAIASARALRAACDSRGYAVRSWRAP